MLPPVHLSLVMTSKTYKKVSVPGVGWARLSSGGDYVADTPAHCALLCNIVDSCVMFQHSQGTNNCHLKTKVGLNTRRYSS